MKSDCINLQEKLRLFEEHWSPKVIGELNDYQIKVAKILGEFVWHKHDETDEMFLCLSGQMNIELRDGVIELKEGELCVIPRGVEHKPCAAEECHVLLIEPRGVRNTGDTEGELTAAGDTWI